MSLTNYGEVLALDAILGGGMAGGPRYAALFTTATDKFGGGTECIGGSYARPLITFGAAVAGSPSFKTNSAPIVFPTATVAWAINPVLAGWMGIFDAPVGGNMIWQAPLLNPREILAGATPSYDASTLVLQLD